VHVNQYELSLATLLAASPGNRLTVQRDMGLTGSLFYASLETISAFPICSLNDTLPLFGLNLTSLILDLFCGQLKRGPVGPWVVLQGDDWIEHFNEVIAAGPNLPYSFDKMPQGLASFLSHLKAKELVNYMWGIGELISSAFLLPSSLLTASLFPGPGFLQQYLPQPYFEHFCKLVWSI
jgi:hypothetical protein